MTKFKVGDKVRCVNPGDGNGLTLGKTYTLTGVSDMKPSEFGSENGWVALVNDNGEYPVGVYGFRFELVEPEKPSKYIIVWSDGFKVLTDDINAYELDGDTRVFELGDELVKKVTWEKKDA